MKLLERITHYFDTLHNFKSPVASNVALQETPVRTVPAFKMMLKEFSVYINGERVDITVDKDTITINTNLNIIINTPTFAVKTKHGIHLNPETTNVEDLKESHRRNAEYYEYMTNCVNCDEPIEQLEEDKERGNKRL